jgi:hypothetical protein
MLSAEECHAKRNELNAMARKARKAGDEALESRCRILAQNLRLMATDNAYFIRERAAAMYEKNKFRFERDMARTVGA